jgi:putative transposase
MGIMSIHIPLYLTAEQRSELETGIKRGNAPARVQTRARILLLADRNTGETHTDAQIAQALLCSSATVANVRRRFLQEGLQAALVEKPRPGRTPKITGDLEAQLSMIACSDPPDGQARWTVRMLTSRLIELGLVDQIDHTTIWERLKKMRLNPGK